MPTGIATESTRAQLSTVACGRELAAPPPRSAPPGRSVYTRELSLPRARHEDRYARPEMLVFHMTARCSVARAALSSEPLAPLAWRALRRAFPGALGAVLMPNHLHLIAVEPSAEVALAKLRAVMSGVRRSTSGGKLVWERAPAPVLVPDAFHLQRQLRYLALNPSRAGLVADPLEWVWSTHRDVIGAVIDPWVRAETIARRLGRALDDFALWQHTYVSADPSVHIDGTPLPLEALRSALSAFPLGVIASAARAATRASAAEVCRRSPTRALFLDLARACGWKDAEVVAAACNARPNAVRWHARQGRTPPRAAWLCLGDERLRRLEGDGLRHPRRIVTRQRLTRVGGVILRQSAAGNDSA